MGIDPVDGLDPFGKIHSEDLITPGQKLSFNIPALHLDNYLDPKGDALGVSCSPAKLSGPRWFDAMQGPVWNVNATKYGLMSTRSLCYATNCAQVLLRPARWWQPLCGGCCSPAEQGRRPPRRWRRAPSR